jgi:deoxyribodipyrimidine photo-lyase
MPFAAPSSPLIVWFRQDLRIADHPALTAAAETGRPIIPLFVLDEQEGGCWSMGGASRWWLEGSLASLDGDLQTIGSRLILRRGKSHDVLKTMLTETGAAGLYFTRHYEPAHRSSEEALASNLEVGKVQCRRFGGALLFEPEAIKTKSGGAYRVFTPFSKACLAQGVGRAPLPAPESLTAPRNWPKSDTLRSWSLRPSAPDWAGGLRESWRPGSQAALHRLRDFLEERATEYASDRDRPDTEGTSCLSPFLHFGEVSPRQIWCRATLWADSHPETRGGIQAFLRELLWREFSYHLLHHRPEMTVHAFNPGFENFPWRTDDQSLRAWQTGMTGYPIVDAGMRQLWHTGWMHNRVRMIVASFLTKHLLLPWQDGARWFWDTLVDADLANNSASWQWVSGSGADAAPYFRIFNPILQGKKFDPHGIYVRQWIPELEGVPDKFAHAPWEGGIDVPGYPAPIVDHKFARQRALDTYAALKKGPEEGR